MEQSGGTLVGRDRELGELLEGLDAAASGRGGLFLLAGEPGIGKSRLADELASRARELGHGVLWGRGWEDAGAPPFWPWVQALRSYVRSADSELVRRQLGSGASDVVQMLPELRDLFPDLAQPPETVSDAARFQLFDSTTTFLRNAAVGRPLLVVIDDLHAADTPSILLLRFMATQLSEMQLLVVGTYRDVALTPDHPLTSAIDELTREPITRVVVLEGLKPKAVGEFIGANTGAVPSTHLVSTVWHETKGNPLFVGEALRLLSAQGRLEDLADVPALRLTVPKGIREVIARRISGLSDASARAIVFGAVLGPEFNVEVLRRVGDYQADEPLALLHEAAQAGILTPVAGTLGRYRFSHDLVRETLYHDLTPGRRVHLHRIIAEVLDGLYGESPEAHLAELAFHFFEATQGAEDSIAVDDGLRPAAKAINYARRAADQALRSLAYEEAARLYRMALAVLDSGDRPDDETRTEILLAIGEAEDRAGDMTAARATLLQAAAIARRTGVAHQLARAALGYGGRLLWGRPGTDKRLIPLLQDALVLLGGSDEQLRVRLLSRLACAWRSSPDQREQSSTLSAQAVELARQLDDPATLSYALTGRYWATWWPENPHERPPIAEEMVAIAEAVGDGERIVDAHLMLYISSAELARMAEARSRLADVIRLADELRQPSQLWLGVIWGAFSALLEGDYVLAEELISRQLEWVHPTISSRDEMSVGRMHLFLLRREQGRVAETEAAVRASIEDFPWYPLHRAALACLLLDLGREAEGRAVFDDLAQDGFQALYRDNEWLVGIGLASEACSLVGDTAAAAVLHAQLKPFAGRHALSFEGSLGATDRYLGLLSATMGLLDQADEHLTAAIRLNEQMGARPWTAHSQDDLGRVLLERNADGDQERAGKLRQAALATARSLGMLALEARITEELAIKQEQDEPTVTTGYLFRLEGDYWTVAFDAETIRIRDAKGMRHLARLLTEPGRELHALDLTRTESGVPERAMSRSDDLTADALGDAGAQLDAEAKASYRRRLEELREEVSEADAWNDVERASRARQEIEFLADELAGAVGLGGRDRKAASAAERARLSVTRAVRAAMARIGEASPSLGRHLESTIRTGTYCSYNPDPRLPISWGH